MGYTPRDTYGGGSSESRESVQGNRERIERDRDRDRNDSYSQRKAQQEAEAKAEAERKAREAADRKAREEKERKAREEAERKAKAQAEREAREREEAEARAKAEQEGQFGNLSQLSGTSGILSRMSLYSPTEAQERMGITNEVQQSLPGRGQITDDEMTKAVNWATSDVARDAAYGVAETVANTFAPVFGGMAVNKVKDALADPSLADQAWADNLTAELAPHMFQANYDNAAKQDSLNKAVKQSMSNGNLVSNAADAAGALTTAGAINGSTTAAKSASILGNPVVGLVTKVADPVIGYARWANRNEDELARLGIDLSQESQTSGSDGDRSNQTKGILANMRDNVTSSPAQQAISETELPQFEWASGDDFNFNYGMGFKRNA